MPFSIRQATIEDVPHLATIIKLTFGEDTSQQQIEGCLKQKGQATSVALHNNTPVGFAFGFITTALDGSTRRELDLQAVHPDYQEQGIGKKLIHHFTELETEADCIRALVAVGNIRMETALSNFGFIAENQVQALYVTGQSPTNEETQASQNSHLIPVITMTYNGIWLEGEVTSQSIHTALNSRQQENDIVGAVVPITDETAIQALESANFNFIKQYRRWHKR